MNTMVVLKNIRKTESRISADYYPEGKEPRGFMSIRLSDGEIIEHKDADSFMAPANVLLELERLAKVENPPEEKTVLWY